MWHAKDFDSTTTIIRNEWSLPLYPLLYSHNTSLNPQPYTLPTHSLSKSPTPLQPLHLVIPTTSPTISLSNSQPHSLSTCLITTPSPTPTMSHPLSLETPTQPTGGDATVDMGGRHSRGEPRGRRSDVGHGMGNGQGRPSRDAGEEKPLSAMSRRCRSGSAIDGDDEEGVNMGRPLLAMTCFGHRRDNKDVLGSGRGLAEQTKATMVMNSDEKVMSLGQPLMEMTRRRRVFFDYRRRVEEATSRVGFSLDVR